MLEAGANLCNTDAVKGRNLKRRASLTAFHRIKSTLAMVIATTADYVSLAGKEQGVRAATAQLNDLFFEYVESFLPDGQADFDIDRGPKLTTFVVAP